MAGETTITVIGNLTDDPELRFTPSGAAVAKFRDRLDAADFWTAPRANGRTASRCSWRARCGGRRRRTSPSRCSGALE